eukprot:SAG31_NODE_105_length_25008_cov_17.439399_20_plen_69_part_00
MRWAAAACGPAFLRQLVAPNALGTASVSEARRQIHVATLVLFELSAEVAAKQREAHARLVLVGAAVAA